MRNSQLLCSQLFFFSPVLGDGKRSACSLALVAPSNPFTPMSMNHHDYSTCKRLLQKDLPSQNHCSETGEVFRGHWLGIVDSFRTPGCVDTETAGILAL